MAGYSRDSAVAIAGDNAMIAPAPPTNISTTPVTVVTQPSPARTV